MANDKYVVTMQLFAYGNIQEYNANKTKFAPLNDKMTRKLQILSLMDLLAETPIVSYQAINQFCGLGSSDPKAVEPLVLEAFQKQLIQARIDQKNRRIYTLSVAGRDIRPEDINKKLKMIHDWETSSLKNAQETFTKLQAQLNQNVVVESEKSAMVKNYIDEMVGEKIAKQLQGADIQRLN